MKLKKLEAQNCDVQRGLAPATCYAPLPGMKVVPDKFGTEEWEILLGGFWVSLCNYLIQQPEARAAFKADTGLNLEMLISRNPLEAMIDKATGFNDATMAAWCDWVTTNHWGVKEHNIRS